MYSEQTSEPEHELENYEVKIPVLVGAGIGVAGAVGIIAIVTTLAFFSGNGLFAAVELIAMALYGPDVAINIFSVTIVTLLHLSIGGVLGAVFAYFMPRLPRGIYLMAGILFGLAAFAASSFVVLPIIAPLIIATQVNIGVLLIAHLVYGFMLGFASATYNLLWSLPSKR